VSSGTKTVDWPFESIYNVSKWNITKGTNPVMRLRPGEESVWPIDSLMVEGIEDWLPKKLDWNASFIPSSRRVGYVPTRKSPECVMPSPSSLSSKRPFLLIIPHIIEGIRL